jgi:cytoskeletal protein CcmA (bactofilin family)
VDTVADRGKNSRDTVAGIGPGITITGDVESSVELQIGGRVNGDVRCQTLFLDETGVVSGTIRAERVRVSGSVEGNVDTVDLAIEATGRIAGNVTYARLKVMPGGIMDGSMTHRPAEGSSAEQNNLKLVEAAAAAPRRVYGE